MMFMSDLQNQTEYEMVIIVQTYTNLTKYEIKHIDTALVNNICSSYTMTIM